MTLPFNFVDALGDGVYGVDTDGRCLFVNRAALSMLRYDTADELIGRNMHAVIHHTRPDGSTFPQNECPLLQTATTGHPVRLENEMLWRRDGTPFFAEYSAFPVSADGVVTGSVITFTDSTVRQDAQKRLAVQYAVSQVLAGGSDAEDMPVHLLAAIGTGLAWDAGLFWLREDDGMLHCVAQWHSPDVVGAERFGEESMGVRLAIGVGIPGQVWALGSALHVANLADQPGPRQQSATRRGLRSAFGFPVMAGTAVGGAVEFYSRRHIEVDESLLGAVSTLGQQIGQTLERRRIARALSATEELTGAILASAPDGIITIDAEGHVVAFNHAAELLFGRPAQQVIGHELSELIFPPETSAIHRRAFSRAVEGEDGLLNRRREVEAVDAAGQRFPIEFSMGKTATWPRLLFTMHLHDISVRRREQARVRESEARFRTIANAIPQLAWMTGSDGGIAWYNQRWYDYTGTTFNEMQGWGWRAVHHPDHVERVERRFRHCFETGEAWEDTFPLRAADGSYRWFLSRALPIYDEPTDAEPQGHVMGWFGSNTDITELRDVEQTLAAARDEAEAANRAKSTFIANMSHELRTPLSAIIGYSEMLGEEIEDGAEAAELVADVRKIEGNARHLLGLINDVLDLAKVESGKMEAFAETFDIAAMCAEVAGTVQALVEKKENRLDVRLGEGLGSAYSDVTRIRQVMLNLLSNAAKFTEKGVITLSVSRDAGSLRIAVSDTGIGMTEEQLAKLFQRFQQADASTTRQFGGTGLGLALTRAFVTLLGGRIDVASQAGEGSTFTVTMPVSLPEAPPADAAPGEAMEAPAGHREVILIVDDDATQRDLMRRFLTRNGYASRAAADGQTGLALARQLRPRAILLDVTMPGLDGWSVLNALKADPDLARIPVVMVTFLSERPLAMSLGAADYVVKPVDWERLRHVMDRFRDAEGDVLVVDDEEDTRLRLRQALERNGWSVAEAVNGEDALGSVARAVPRVILLDLNMPVMDGFEFIRKLRDRPGCAEIPVVVLTALDLTNEDRRRLRGANQVLNKGDVSLREIADRLNQLGVAGEAS